MEEEGRKKARESEKENNDLFPSSRLTAVDIFLKRHHWKGCYSF